MKSPEAKYLREAREGQTKFLILCRHTRRRDQTSTSWCYGLPVSIFDAFFRLRRVWLSLFSLAFPLLLFCFVDSHDARFRCLYVVCVMISSWLTAANDPVLVAIYPIILCPLLGIAGVKSLAESYFRPVSFLMIGTSLVAAAFSRTGLDATISAFILKKFNSNPPLLCLGLMLCSATLSMWINNASTAVILSPIAIHVLAGWAKRLKEDTDLQQVLLSVSKKNGAAESSRKIPLAPPTRYDSLAGLKSLASTSAEAVSSVVPSKEAIVAYVEKDHGKAYTDCFPRTEAPLHSAGEQERNGDYRAGTAPRVTAAEVKATGALSPAAASVRKSLIGEGGQESFNSGARGQESINSGARIVSDTGTVLDHSKSKYCDTTSSTSLTFIEEKDAHLLRRLKNMILLGIAYSATLGGMSTLNGSFVNPTLVHVLESSYDFDSAAQENPINFTSWMAFACPLALFCVFLAWLALSSVWLGVFTTAHAVLWLVIHPFTVVVAAVKLLRDISQRLTRKGLPPTVNLSAACAVQDAISVQSATENEVDLSKGGPSCTQSRDIEAPEDPNAFPSSVSSHTMKNDAAEGQAGRITSGAADGKEQTIRRTFPATSANTAVKNSHPFAQVEVLLLLAALISLWLTRSTGSNGKRGWGLYFVPNFVDDSVPVLLLGLFLFFLPLEPPDFTWSCFCCRMKSRTNGQGNNFLNEEASHRSDEGRRKRRSKRSSEAEELQAGHSGENNSRTLECGDEKEGDLQGGPQRVSWLGRFRQECQRSAAQRKEYTPILTYSYAIKHIEWGALLLLGGGFAMATSMKRTGLDLWIGNAVLRFAMLDRPALVVSVLLLASCLTEVMSNTATANVLLPILNGVARQAKDSPLLVLIPATVGAQFAFMLPLGTAPNAIVLKKGKLRPLDMFWTGLVVKLFAIGATMLAMMTWSDWLFDLKTRPAWAG